MGLIVAFYLRLTDRIMSPRSGFRFVSSVFPGIPLLKQLHRRAILYRPSIGAHYSAALWAAVHYHYRRDGGNFATLAEDNFAHGNSHEFRCPSGQFRH